MRKLFFAALALSSGLVFANGGGKFEVVKTEKLNIPTETACYAPLISPTGDYLLVTDNSMKGLQKFDLATGELTTVTTDTGAGYNAKISNDGTTIVYRQSERKDNLRYYSVKSVDVNTGKTETLVKQSRNVTAFGAVKGTAFALDKRDVKTKRVSGKKASIPAIASISDGNLIVTKNGKSQTVNPLGSTRYLWASVSPDGSKLLFAAPKDGIASYVCNIDGSNPVRLGIMSAPKWMGNDYVVGMVDKDNGEVMTESVIAAVKADGTGFTVLTDNSSICMYPSASADATKIVYNTAEGDVYLMSINVK